MKRKNVLICFVLVTTFAVLYGSMAVAEIKLISDISKWQVFEPQEDPAWGDCLNTVENTPGYNEYTNCSRFYGAAFDGQYVYTYAAKGNYLIRYDTTKPFSQIENPVDPLDLSWEKMYMGDVHSDLSGKVFYSLFYFDGKIYMSPDNWFQHWVEYDTRSQYTFTDSRAYSYYAKPLSPDGLKEGIRGVCSDGRYIYGTPFNGNTAVRYDPYGPVDLTTGSVFKNDVNWTLKNMDGIPNVGFLGCTYSNTELVFIPYGELGNPFVKYDTWQSDFMSNESWSIKNVYPISDTDQEQKVGYHEGCDTPRYTFYPPYGDGAVPIPFMGVLLRRDKTKEFTDIAAWDYVDLETFDLSWKGFWSCAYDGGDHIYLTPHQPGTVAVSYNITKPLDEIASYDHIILTTLSQMSMTYDISYTSILYANGYIYMFGRGGAPGRNGKVLRFDTGRVSCTN